MAVTQAGARLTPAGTLGTMLPTLTACTASCLCMLLTMFGRYLLPLLSVPTGSHITAAPPNGNLPQPGLMRLSRFSVQQKVQHKQKLVT